MCFLLSFANQYKYPALFKNLNRLWAQKASGAAGSEGKSRTVDLRGYRRLGVKAELGIQALRQTFADFKLFVAVNYT